MFLLRDLVSARTWLAMTQHLAGLFIGLAVFTVFTVGLSMGVSLLVLALVGLPLLGVTVRLAHWFAQAVMLIVAVTALTGSRSSA